jgi:hypothetical protein
MIDLDKLTAESYRVAEYCKWIDQATTHAEMDVIRGVLMAHKADKTIAEEKQLTDDEYAAIAKHGKQKREEIDQ